MTDLVVPATERERWAAIAALSAELHQLHELGRTDEAITKLSMWARAFQEQAPEDEVGLLELQGMGAWHLLESADAQAVERSVHYVLGRATAFYDALGENAQALDPQARADRAMRLELVLASASNVLGALFRDAGNVDAARECFERALEYPISDQQRVLRPNVIGNLATLDQQAGDTESAKAHLDQALAEIADTPMLRGTLLPARLAAMKATLIDDAEHFDEAERSFRTALSMAMAASATDSPFVAEIQLRLGELLHQHGHVHEAQIHLRQATSTYGRTVGFTHPNAATAIEGLMLLLWEVGRLEDIPDLLESAAGSRDWVLRHDLEIGDETTRLNRASDAALLANVWISMVIDVSAVAPEVVGLGLDMVLRRKAMLTDVLASQRSELRGEFGDPETVTALTAARAALAAAALSAATSDQEVERLRSEVARLESLAVMLERLGSDPFPVEGAEPSVRQLAHREAMARFMNPSGFLAGALSPGDVLIEYLDYARATPPLSENALCKSYVAFVCVGGIASPLIVDLGDAAPVVAAVEAFGAAADRDGARLEAGSAGTPAMPEAGRVLSELVLAPVLRKLRQTPYRRLLVAADGLLAQVPLHALPYAGAPVLERYEVVYLASGMELVRADDEDARPPPAPPCVVADPDYDAHGVPVDDGEGFDRLEGAAQEGRVIAELLGVTPVVGADATEGAVRALASPAVLHVAAHGWYLPDPGTEAGRAWAAHPRLKRLLTPSVDAYLARSALVLAGFNTVWRGGAVPAEVGDGLLTAAEVAELDLRGTELVVLSACDTGRGLAPSHDGALGLRRALTLAGARSMVVSLWQVPDEATRRLMVAFYGRLIAGEPRGAALRAAQLELAGEGTEPYLWSGFVFQGRSGPLPETLLATLDAPPRAQSTLERIVAETSDRDEVARRVEEAALGGDVEAQATLAQVYVDGERLDEVVPWLERLAARDPNAAHSLAQALERLGRAEDAQTWLRRAAEAGSGMAASQLGDEALVASDPVAALGWFERSAELGNIAGAHNYAVMAVDGEREAALRWWRWAAERGMPESANNLAQALLEDGDPEGVERFLRMAAQGGHLGAGAQLGELLIHDGRTAEGERWLLAAARAGRGDAMAFLGEQLLMRGSDRGRFWLRAAFSAGREHSLAVIAHRADRALLERRARGGDMAAAVDLGLVDLAHDRREEAAAWLERAAPHSGLAATTLASVLHDRGDQRASKRWAKHAERRVRAEDALGAGLAAYREGDVARAERCWREAADAGVGQAAFNLASSAFRRGDVSGVARLVDVAADDGEPELAGSFAIVLAEQGRHKEARHWYGRAVDVAMAADGRRHCRRPV